jgi:hypothetical protein
MNPGQEGHNHRDHTDPDMDSEHRYQCCGSGSACIRINFGRLYPDPDPGGQKLPPKIEKTSKFHVSVEVLDVLFWGLKGFPAAWTSFVEVLG